MFSSIMVPEGVRRLFQVLTGEDMTDADEGVLFAVADALESGAVGVGEVGGFVAELVGKVRTEFSGKAADRFAGGLEVFDGLLSSGEGALRELAVFVRDLARQVRYLKLVTIYGLELLLLEMAWAVAMAGATGGASMAWLAARMAVMRLLLSRWWGQLFMRLAMAAAGGVAFNVVPDLQAQLQMLGEKSGDKWDGKLTEQAAGMGAFSALVSLPMSALGGLVSNALTTVLVRGLGDEVDAAILEAAVRRAVAEHAELYPVSAMARFADVVGEHLDVYAGMSVRGMWSARFGSGIGEALENALSELFGEVGYLVATGQEVTWNPFSVTAGFFESVFSGVGNLAGLAWRGKLHPEGPSPYLEGTSRREGTTTDGGGFDEEKTPLLGTGSGSQTGNTPGSPGKDNTFDASDSSKPSDASKPSDVDSVFPVRPVDSAAVSVPSRKDPVVSGSSPVSAVVVGGTDGKRGADDSVPGGKPARGVPVVPGSGQDRPVTPLPAYSDGVVGSGQDRSVTPPPAYRPVAGGDPVPGGHGVDVPGNRPLEVLTSQTPDSPAVTPHASGVPADTALPETGRPGSAVDSDTGVPADAALPETVRSGSVVDSGSGVPAGQPTSPNGMPGRDGDSHVDLVAAHGDSHRVDGAAVSPDSAMVPVEGSQAVPYLRQDPAAVLPVGLPVDTVRVPVPADVVAGGGLVEFVRGGVADSTGGPVLLVSPGNSTAGVVVSPGQGSALAQGMGRDVVAMTPGQGGRTPQWTVFGADGSARPLAGPGAPVPAGGRGGVAGLADATTAVPAGTAASGTAPVREWSDSDVRGEIERARQLELSPEDKDAVRLIVQGTHDIRRLAGRGAAVSLDEVVALVAAKRRELGRDHRNQLGRDHRGQVVEFSRELADRLGTEGSGLSIQAGAGPADQAGRSGESAAGSGRHTSGGPSLSGAAVPVDDTAGAAGDQRGPEEQAASTVVEIRERIAALQDAVELLEAQKAELEAVQERDEDRQALWESERALQAELAVLRAELAKFVPAGIARLAELTGRMERHLGAMPSDFDPNGVRANVETAKNMVRQGDWTSADLHKVEESFPGAEAAERALRNARRAKVREVYVQAKRAIAQGQGRVPVTYFEDGVPGGVSSRPDVRLGFEVEFKLPGDNFDARVDSLGAELEQAGLVDWRAAHGSKLVIKKEAEAILSNHRWVLLKESERFEVEATSPILRNDTERPVGEQVWPSMEKLLGAVQRQGGFGSESGGHINVSFVWQLTPVQYVRVAQVAKVFEAVLYRLGNVAGGDESKQRHVGHAGPISLPSDPYAVDGTGADGYDSLPNPDDKYRAVRFDAVGFDSDRLEFRVWAGDAGELTGNPGLWQVRAELSAAMMLAGTDPGIYRELDRLMGDPDLLGYDDQTRDEGAWLEKLAEFLELLPLSEAGQVQVVQLFAWTRPWKLSDVEEGYPALIVSLPQQSVLFPAPGASKAQVVAQAYSYQLYKDASLVVARMTSDRSGIRLRNGQAINFADFARLLNAYHVGRESLYNEEMWTVLAIPRASSELLVAVLQAVNGPVLATISDVCRTPDGRLLAGDYERQSDGRVQFRPARDGWIEVTNNEDEPGRFTGKFDLGEALMDCRTRLLPGDPAEVYRYWPARGSGS
ncbi:WXG100-like domain-containing protein [Saccharopolyspora pogona]|uniref:WXG100-like domain-containing protein n=1 Tax=Saccharopolyspora pogona TaxID=333966 RepID=UPI0021DFA209|nr:hypothetical protein [Saccharopolyspora pogona]